MADHSNPAGWDKNSNTELRGVSILEEWLSSDPENRFWSDIKKNDKTPDFDGYIMFGRPENSHTIPSGTFVVQVRSKSELSDARADSGIKRYECKTDIFVAASSHINYNPVALIVVDVSSKTCYWIDVTQEYVDALKLKPTQTKKTISLADSDILKDYDMLYERVKKRYREHLIHLSTLADSGIVTIGGIGKKRLSELQRAYQVMSDRLAKDLCFLPKLSFSNTWSTSLGYSEIPDGYVLAVIPMRIGAEQLPPIREIGPLFGFTLSGNRETDPPLSRVFSGDFPIEDAINQLLVFWVEQFAKTQVICPRVMSDVMLSEAMFYCADLISRQTLGLLSKDGCPDLFDSDRMDPAECRRLYDACYQSAIDTVLELNCNCPVAGSFFYVELFGANGINEAPAVSKSIADYYYSTKTTPHNQSWHVLLEENVVPFSLMEEVVEEVERRGLVVERPWRYSPRAKLDARFEHLADVREGEEDELFDLLCVRSDYIENYKTLMGFAHDEALRFEKEYFFGVEQSWDEHAYAEYTLLIDDRSAITRYARYRDCAEGYEFEVLPLEKWKDWTPPRTHAGGTINQHGFGPPPAFNCHRPLYLEVLRRIMRLIALKCPEAKLRGVTMMSGEEARPLSLDGRHVLMSGGLTVGY